MEDVGTFSFMNGETKEGGGIDKTVFILPKKCPI